MDSYCEPMVSLKIPPMVNLCDLLLRILFFEQEDAERCGREGLSRWASAALIHTLVMLIKA